MAAPDQSFSPALIDLTKQQTVNVAAATPAGVFPTVVLASFPPASPVDGQTVILILPSSYDPIGGKPVRWICTYDLANTVWHVAGPPLQAQVDTVETTSSATYTDLATVGPTVATPRPGDYIVEVGAQQCAITNTNVVSLMAFTGGGVTASDADAAQANDFSVGGLPFGVSAARYKTGMTAGNVVAKYRASAASGQWQGRRISLTPVRIT
jgi:hypothetical protein